MQRCYLNIDQRFFLKKNDDYEQEENKRKMALEERMRRMIRGDDDQSDHSKVSIEKNKSLLDKRPLSFLFDDEYQLSDSATIRTRFPVCFFTK